MVVERFNAAQWVALSFGSAIALGMVLYPPWRCHTSTGYRVPSSAVKQLSKGPLQKDFPPNEPMLYDIHRSTVVYGWLFCPPTSFGGARWNAEIEWGRLGTRCGIVLLAMVAGVVLLRDSGVLRRLLVSRRG